MPSLCDLNPKSNFEVIIESERSQAATMVLRPGETTGGPKNKHEGSDQWMYVLKGTGEIIIDEKIHELKTQRLVLIKANENHEVKNTGSQDLETLNIYAPPEY